MKTTPEQSRAALLERGHPRGGSRPHPNRTGRNGAVWTPYSMLAPFLLLFLGFFIYPFFYAVYLSVFASKQGLTRFAGLSNYALALTDPQFWSSIRTVVYFGLLQAVAVLLVGLVLALILDSPLIRGSGLFRLVYF